MADLETAQARVAELEELASALRRAEALACRRFAATVVVAAMRRVVEYELAGR